MKKSDREPTAEEIESGEFYRAGRRWYADIFHRPIAERSYYLVVIFLAIVNFFFAIHSFAEIFPIRQRIPFVVYSNDVWEDIPHIKTIGSQEIKDKNVSVMQYLLEMYLANRESYDLGHYEIRYRSVWSQSTPQVFGAYRELMDASNVYGPYHLYSNQAKRTITINSFYFEPVQGQEGLHAHIVFTAVVSALADDQEINRSKWQADILYKYTPFTVDQSLDKAHWWIANVFGLTGDAPSASDGKPKVVPMTFIVSDYQVKELLE